MQSRISVNCVAMGSGAGSNLKFLLENPGAFTICAGFVDRVCRFQEICENHKIPCFYLDGISVCGSHPMSSSRSDFESYVSRVCHFENEIIDCFEKFESSSGVGVDLILLAGYLRVLRGPILKKYRGRILNVHPGDLRLIGPDGKRLLTGLNAVLKAIIVGCEETFSTVHFVDEEVDGGSILAVSNAARIEIEDSLKDFLMDFRRRQGYENILPTHSSLVKLTREMRRNHPVEFAKLSEYANLHQNLQKKLCDWPTYARALEIYADAFQKTHLVQANQQGECL